jgi:CheY-like chemotaxis protein/HPt (histidine-containing phosphotransfer) domain-containing protein
LALINDVLDLAKIEAGQMQVESVACSPHQIIAETVSVLRVRAIEKGIALEYRWNGRVPESIRIDPYRFKQLLINLIGNAIKFTEQGCVLVVAEVVEADAFREAGEPGDSTDLLVEIRDTGIGIAAEKLETVFEPFVQADESVTRKYGGTGLGLAISRRIAASLGGCLSAASVLGRGSSFAIRVPTGSLDGVRMLEQPPQTGRTVARQESRGELRLDGVRVLVVDDGETNRRLVRLLLQRVGATVESAENGKVAIELARRTPFDVILLDMQMPVMDGYSAARALREQGYAGAVIALTAHAMKGDREKCEQAGCTGFLSKPIDADVLMHTVAGCAAARRSPPDGEPHAPHDGAKGVEPIYSLLPTDDEELRDVVLEFIDTLSNKMVEMETAWDAGDFESLEQLAHWLKGAGGTVGFRCFTSSAAELERSASSGDRTGTASSLSVLRGLQQRVTV